MLMFAAFLAATGYAAGQETRSSSPAYTIGGQVLGVTGTGLVLQDNGGHNLAIGAGAASYAFTFSGAIPRGGAPYSITVFSNPSGQACTVANPVGTALAAVRNADLVCTNLARTTYTVSGTVTGLTAGSLLLQDDLGLNDTDLLPVSADGAFTFVDRVGHGDSYGVSVFAQPTTRNCVVNHGSGTALSKVTNVSVVCVGDWAWMGGNGVIPAIGGKAGIYGTRGVAASGNYPGSREQSLTWTDKDDNLWLFGGYGIDSKGANGQLNDLWKFSPKQGKHGEWTWMGGNKVAPASTTFGAAGASGVYGKLGKSAPANIPGGREQTMSWIDASGNLWVFGGEGIDAHGVTGELNDLWKFDPRLGANGEWAWMGGSDSVGLPFGGPSGVYGTRGKAAPANIPGGRYGAISWIDASGNLWLFGGNGVDSKGVLGYLNDLWKFDPKAGTSGEWTWFAGSDVLANKVDSANNPQPRDAGMGWVSPAGDVWLFGGIGNDSKGNTQFLNDLWKYTPRSNGAAGEWTRIDESDTTSYFDQPGVYGSLGVASSANVPGGRFSGVTWIDASGNLWLYGGDGYDSDGVNGYLNDLWMFDPKSGARGAWTWVGGGVTVGRSGGQTGVYGTLRTPNAASSPGGRFGVAGWTDSSGNLWLFGGDGYDSKGNQGYLNDLWQFLP